MLSYGCFLDLADGGIEEYRYKKKILASTEVALIKQRSRAREMNQFTCTDNVQSHLIHFRTKRRAFFLCSLDRGSCTSINVVIYLFRQISVTYSVLYNACVLLSRLKKHQKKQLTICFKTLPFASGSVNTNLVAVLF